MRRVGGTEEECWLERMWRYRKDDENEEVKKETATTGKR